MCRNALEDYSSEVKDVAAAIVRELERALEIKEGEMTEMFKDGNQSMRMNYYPACPEPEKVIGLTPHSDAVGLTILLQINQVEGLKIKKEGKWIPVAPLPDAFIVNIGDIMEVNLRFTLINVAIFGDSDLLGLCVFMCFKKKKKKATCFCQNTILVYLF